MKLFKIISIIILLIISNKSFSEQKPITMGNFVFSESMYKTFELVSFDLSNNTKISIDSKKEWKFFTGNNSTVDILTIETKENNSLFSLSVVGENLTDQEKRQSVSNSVMSSQVNDKFKSQDIKYDYVDGLDNSIFFFLEGDIMGNNNYNYTIIGTFDIEETTFMFIELINDLEYADEFYTLKTSIKKYSKIN
jgi:hypothetical protein